MTTLSWFKTILLLISLGCVASMKRPCTKQSDCDLYWECCSKLAFSDESYCVLRRRLNEICLANGMDEMTYNGVYDINCPCQYGLECRTDEKISEDGQEIGLPTNPRCYGPPKPPQENVVNTENQGSGNNDQASASSGSNSESSAQGSGNNPQGSNSEASAESDQSNSAA